MKNAEKEKVDFSKGTLATLISDGGRLQGKAGGEDVVLARRGDEFFAVGASGPHYGGPLVKGLTVATSCNALCIMLASASERAKRYAHQR